MPAPHSTVLRPNGWQQRPFVLHPARLDPGPAPIVGTSALHATLKRWLREVQGAAPLEGATAR